MKKKKIKILLVDDEPDILEIVGYNLKNAGYKVYTAKNGLDAVKIAKKEIPHLIILDIMMPQMNGIEACEKIRATKGLENVLITFFTARGEDYSQVTGFNVGADDYITKPIKPKVLLSKIKGLLRRVVQHEEPENSQIVLDGFTIDRTKYVLLKDSTKMELPRKEFELLWLLASKPGKVFNRDEILENVWGNEVIVGGRTIDVHIRKLREKIGDNYFKTVKGVGYKFVLDED